MGEYNLMLLVVDRNSRRVLDCENLEYSWRLDEVVKRHDLNKVDLVLRERTETAPFRVSEVEVVNTDVETPQPVAEDEDIPF